MKYAVITRHRRESPVRLMCRVLGVALAGYYAWRRRSPSLHALADDVLMAHVSRVFKDRKETYGAVRILHELREEGGARARSGSRGSCAKRGDGRGPSGDGG